MAGWLTDGVPNLVIPTGNEQVSVDTQIAGGASPQTASMTLAQIAAAVLMLNNSASKTMVAGSRYSTSFNIGSPAMLTGIGALVGGTGGTDKWIFELHNSAGALVATTALAGVTTAAANSIMQIPFTAPVTVQPGQYFLTVQSNGTTATLGTLNAPTSPYLTGSATGAFGTSASITPPTTYTANLGPIAQVY